MASLALTIRESVRYRGRSGHYSWLAHRVSGLAILLFLIIHTWDTANAYFWPQAYAWSLALFKNPFFGAGEVAIMAAVLYTPSTAFASHYSTFGRSGGSTSD